MFQHFLLLYGHFTWIRGASSNLEELQGCSDFIFDIRIEFLTKKKHLKPRFDNFLLLYGNFTWIRRASSNLEDLPGAQILFTISELNS